MATVTVKRSDSARVVVPPPLIYLIGLIIGYGLGLVVPVVISPSVLFLILGVVLIFGGLSIAFSAIRTFRSHRTTTNTTMPATTLVQDGPFRFTRNPMYLSLAIVYLGLALIMDSLWALVLVVPVVTVVNYYVIAREERYLERAFGDDYRMYRAKVRRWI